MIRYWLMMIAACLAGHIGCADSTSQLAVEYEVELYRLTASGCECVHSDRDECFELLDGPQGDSLFECLRRTVNAHSESDFEYLSCWIDYQRAENDAYERDGCESRSFPDRLPDECPVFSGSLAHELVRCDEEAFPR